MTLCRSQTGVHDVVQVAPKPIGVDLGEVSAPFDEFSCRRTARWPGPQLGNLSPIPCHGQDLTTSDAVQHLTAMITEVAHCY